MVCRAHPFRFHACALLLLCAALVCAVPASAASTPAILRMDAFVAAQYDANTALVFFNSVVMPANLGVPAGAWPQAGPQSVSRWVDPRVPLRLVRSGEEAQWRHYWPGGEAYAPKVGGMYALALGSSSVRGTLSSIGYLPVCETDVAGRTGDGGCSRPDALCERSGGRHGGVPGDSGYASEFLYPRECCCVRRECGGERSHSERISARSIADARPG